MKSGNIVVQTDLSDEYHGRFPLNAQNLAHTVMITLVTSIRKANTFHWALETHNVT